IDKGVKTSRVLSARNAVYLIQEQHYLFPNQVCSILKNWCYSCLQGFLVAYVACIHFYHIVIKLPCECVYKGGLARACGPTNRSGLLPLTQPANHFIATRRASSLPTISCTVLGLCFSDHISIIIFLQQLLLSVCRILQRAHGVQTRYTSTDYSD